MMRLNRKVEYALISLRYMSQKRPGQLTTAKEICEKHGVPFDATSRVLQVMAQAGMLKSEQGSHGGYLIIKDLNKISFHLLNELIIGPLAVTKCMSEEGEDCELVSKCNIMTPVRSFNLKFTEFLKNLTVYDVLEEKEKIKETREAHVI